jgi:hypothetical protein
VLGEPLDGSLDAIGWGDEHGSELLVALRSPSRDVRARALARALTPVVVALEATRLA